MSDSEDFYGFTPLKLTKSAGSEVIAVSSYVTNNMFIHIHYVLEQ
jgi:hypothetical protein